MSRSVVILRKKALVLGISSVLAGWAASDGLYAEVSDSIAPNEAKPVSTPTPTEPEFWPPTKTATIDQQNPSLDAISGIEISSDKNISMQGGTLKIPSADKVIKVTNTATVPGIVGQSGTNTLNLTSTGTAVEVGANATGVKVENGSLTISGEGSITAAKDAANTTGVSVAGGTLTIDGSTIEGSKAAIAIAGGDSVTFKGSSVIVGLGDTLAAVDASGIVASDSAKPVTLNIQDGTFTGEIKGGGSKDDKITITATTGDGIKGNISGFETIDIQGTGWTAQGHVSGADKLKTNSAIEDLYVSKKDSELVKSADPNILRIKMASETLAIETDTASGADGKVKNLHILDATHLKLSDGKSSSPGPATVDTITVGDTAGWQVDGLAKDVSVVKTNGTIENLYVNAQQLIGSGHGSLGVNSKGADNLTIATNNKSGDGLGKVGTLYIYGNNTKLTLSDDVKDHKPGFASIDNIFVDGITDWHVNGFASRVEALNTLGTVNNLYVYDQNYAPSTIKNSEAETLRVRSDKLEVNTLRLSPSAVGKIDHLHILGATELNLNKDSSDLAEIDKITVGGTTGWRVKGLASKVNNLTTSSAINNLYVNSQPPTSPQVPIVQPDTLYVVPDSNSLAVTTITAEGATGAITNLNISGNPKLSGSGPITVNNIEVNDSGWTVSPQLEGVKKVTANSPTPAPASQEPVINTISLNPPSVRSGSGNVTGTLNITVDKDPIKITATEPGLIATVNVGSNAFVDSITNAKTINITGSGWEFEELVTNPETIDVAKGLTVDAINSVFSGTTVATPKETLNVAFDHLADVNGYLNIGGDGTISNIDFSTVVNRPSLMYTPSTSITKDNIGNIEGNLAKADTLVLTGNVTTTGLPKGFSGIEYPSPPAEINPNLKRLGLGGIVNDTIITTELVADLVVSPSENGENGNNSKPTISIPFTASGMPSAFYLKTAGTGSYSIDFSSADRPTTTFEIAGGTVTALNNGAALNDKLIITAGTLPDVDISSMSALSINGSAKNGPGWNAPGTFSNLNSLDITSSGEVAALNVAGQPLSKPSGATLNVLTTSTQQLPVTIASGGKLAELHASDGANLGAIDVGGTLGTIIATTGASLGAIDVGGELTKLNANTGSSFGTINVASGGKLPTLNATGAILGDITIVDSGILSTLNAIEGTTLGDITIADGGTLSTLTATGSTLGAITVADGGTLTTLYAKEGARLGDIVGAQTTVNIAKGASLGAITNASTVNINGVANTLGPITNAGTVNASSLAFEQVQVGSGLPAGAKTGSTSGQNLVLNTPKKAVNLTTKRIGTLTLGSGAKLGATSGGVNNLAITGSDWSAGTIPMTPDAKGTATVNIGADVNVAGITVTNSSVGTRATEEPQPLNLTITPIPTGATEQTLAVTTSGNISDDLNFSGLPKGTTVNLEEAGGSLKGNIKGVNNVVFSGDSKFNGTIEADSVKVTGKLNAMQSASAEASLTVSRSAPASRAAFGEPPQPALDIASGGTLVINSPISFKAGYQQNGEIDLEPVLDASARQSVVLPSVNVSSITIGPDAKVVFDSSKVSAEQIVFDPSKDSADQYVLMKAESDINQPVKVAATNEQYDHYYAMLTSSDKKSSNKQLMVLATQPMQAFVCDMAAAGGAPASAVRAVDVAVAPKNPTEAAAARSRTRTTGDPLNTFVVQRASTPASAAQLAKQLTPNNTGSNITASRDAQQMSSKAIDTRNTNRRTGMNSGDMMESGGVWIQYAYNNAKQDEKDGVSGYKDKTNGFTLGADWELDPMFDAGVAYTYAKSDISGEGVGSGSTMDSKNHIFTLYGSYDQDDMFMDGMISYASGDNKGHRNVSGNRVQSSYDSKSWGIGLSGGMTLPTSEEWSWQPLVAFNYYRITTDDYRESAPLSHLAFDQVKNDNYTIMELGAGVRLMGDIQMDDLAFRPAFKLMVLHDFKDDPVTMTAHYAAGGESFVVHGAKRDTTRYQFAASVDMDLHDNMTLSFNYSHDWMDNFKSDGFIARLRYDF
ncbi:autotransporter domain-containing protein [Endozoicomonas acroporae]|uniref:autotransporter domain-containing protein n=1 Tax=Endozoicomonas acroporae TaxID=1701104 RepID=UPI0013D359A0|nr:autotransporter domain-containing protein [Endozoicomonas acroporae]